jgi:putative component of toxin-antitoxin plasmid stabilization module
MRVDVGPGYRIYFVRQGVEVYVLLVGGDKSSAGEPHKRILDVGRVEGDLLARPVALLTNHRRSK